jgi:predicted TIM-barrel enzyme
MPAPLKPHLFPVVLHDEEAIPQGTVANPLVVTGPGGGALADIVGVQQVQNEETVTPLAASGTSPQNARDMQSYESFGVSVYVEADPAQGLDTTVFVENSADGVNWRPVDTVSLKNIVAGSNASLNRVYSVTRQFYRVYVVNNDNVNALAATEVYSMQKPI